MLVFRNKKQRQPQLHQIQDDLQSDILSLKPEYEALKMIENLSQNDPKMKEYLEAKKKELEERIKQLTIKWNIDYPSVIAKLETEQLINKIQKGREEKKKETTSMEQQDEGKDEDIVDLVNENQIVLSRGKKLSEIHPSFKPLIENQKRLKLGLNPIQLTDDQKEDIKREIYGIGDLTEEEKQDSIQLMKELEERPYVRISKKQPGMNPYVLQQHRKREFQKQQELEQKAKQELEQKREEFLALLGLKEQQKKELNKKLTEAIQGKKLRKEIEQREIKKSIKNKLDQEEQKYQEEKRIKKEKQEKRMEKGLKQIKPMIQEEEKRIGAQKLEQILNKKKQQRQKDIIKVVDKYGQFQKNVEAVLKKEYGIESEPRKKEQEEEEKKSEGGKVIEQESTQKSEIDQKRIINIEQWIADQSKITKQEIYKKILDQENITDEEQRKKIFQEYNKEKEPKTKIDSGILFWETVQKNKI